MAALVAGALIAARGGTPGALAQTNEQGEATVSVQGVAARAIEPDQTLIEYSVSVINRRASTALGDGAAALRRIARGLALEEIDDNNRQTIGVSLREEFDWTEDGRVSLGFRYENRVRLVAEGADRAGRLLDVISEAGRDDVRIDHVGFEVSNRGEIEREVMLDALDDARANADAIAERLGLSVGRVVTVNVTSSLSPVVETEEAADEAFADARLTTPTYSGREAISARVAITYSLSD